MLPATQQSVMKLLEKNTPSEFLNELLTRAYDAEQGFLVASEEVENQALKDWFKANSDQHCSFGHSIKKLLKDLDVEPDKGSSITGKIHQAFIKLRATLSADQDRAIIAECRRGEEAALKDYEEALQSIGFRSDARKVLEDQAERVQNQLEALDIIEKSLSGS